MMTRAITTWRPGPLLALLLLTALLPGCSTIIEGTSQTISVNTNPPGAACDLWRENRVVGSVPNTPGGVVVEKTKYDITVTCDKPGYQTATGMLESGIEGATFANIILGGGIGWAIDSASGADNKYPETITVSLVPMTTPSATAALAGIVAGGTPIDSEPVSTAAASLDSTQVTFRRWCTGRGEPPTTCDCILTELDTRNFSDSELHQLLYLVGAVEGQAGAAPIRKDKIAEALEACGTSLQ